MSHGASAPAIVRRFRLEVTPPGQNGNTVFLAVSSEVVVTLHDSLHLRE